MRDLWISKAIYGAEEVQAVNRVLQSKWLGTGEETTDFEESIATLAGKKHGIFVNSGSSALLLGLLSLNLPKGSEVITCAAGFPSTLSPILHLGLKPVLVDCELRTLNIDPERVKKALSRNTSAIIFAHAAGNPVKMDDMSYVLGRVPSIEDACDALGASYNDKPIGSFGTVSAFSFYASHHITAAGGGGMALTDDKDLITRMFSMRDWGKRYDSPGYYQQNNSVYDTLVDGVFYDRSYSYDTVGFNLKLTEINAAFANAQLKRLDGFIDARRKNFWKLHKAFENDVRFINTEFNRGASPFFYVFILSDRAPFSRKQFADRLEAAGIKTRPFFAGNILRQPALKNADLRVVGEMTNANKLMNDAVMIGVHPDITDGDLDYIIQVVNNA